MNENIFEFKTMDGTALSGVHWSKDDSPKALLAIVHGHGEHKMRYKHVAEHFINLGYEVFAMDHRGHGQSEGKRGHSPSHDQLLDDVEQFLIYIRGIHTELPLVLYGHSMGGNIVANYVLKRKTNELKAAVLSSPMLKLAFDPPKWKETLGNMMANIWPSLTQPTDLDASKISRDKEEVRKYVDDPLVHDKMSAALYTGLMSNAQWAIDHASELSLSTLAFHGSDDQIISYKGTEELADNAGEQMAFKLFEGYYHEPHNDLNKEEVLKYMSEWVENKL